MKFEKIKDVVVMNTPGVDEISAVISNYRYVMLQLGDVRGMINGEMSTDYQEDIYGIIGAIKWLKKNGVISRHTYRVASKQLESCLDEINDGSWDNGYRHVFEAIDILREEGEDELVRYLRAPKAVGTGRKVRE